MICPITQEDVVCSILGLGSDIASRLHAIPEQFRYHRTDSLWLKQFMSERMLNDEYRVTESSNGYDATCQELYMLGFTDSRSKIVATWILEQVPCRNQQALLYWVNMYIDSMFDYNILQSDTRDYPHNNHMQNVWSDVEVEYENEDGLGKVHSVKIYNTSLEEANGVKRNGTEYPASASERWYHATDQKSASHIMRSGINPGYGNAYQDFSDGSGFYLTQSFDYAVDWAKGLPAPHSAAIIVYKVSSEEIESYNGIRLLENDAMWRDLVKYNRGGQDCVIHTMMMDLRKAYSKADYVEGAMVGNGRNSTQLKWEPEKMGRDDANQLCIISQAMADKFGRVQNIDAVIFM